MLVSRFTIGLDIERERLDGRLCFFVEKYAILRTVDYRNCAAVQKLVYDRVTI